MTCSSGRQRGRPRGLRTVEREPLLSVLIPDLLLPLLGAALLGRALRRPRITWRRPRRRDDLHL